MFDHTIDEAKHLLLSYADSQDKLRFRLPGIKAKRLSDTVIRTQALAIDTTVRNHGISRITVADDDVEKERSEFLPLLDFLHESQENDYRSEYDFKSVVGIKKCRNGAHPIQIENCSAILITQDLRLANTIRKYTLSKQHEVSFAKLDTDLIAMLWLQTFTACPDMPREILLTNAAAAVTLSDEVRRRAIELTDMWVADGSMDSSMAQILRSDRLDEFLLVDSTANDPDSLDLEKIKSVVMDVLSPEIEAEKEKVRVQGRIEYEQMVEALNRKNAQDIAVAESNRQQQQKEEARKRLIEQSRRINNKAQRISQAIRRVAQCIILIMFTGFEAVLGINQAIDMYKTYATNETPLVIPWLGWLMRIVFIVAAIYGTVTMFLDGKITVRRILNALERKVYDIARSHYERVANEWSS